MVLLFSQRKNTTRLAVFLSVNAVKVSDQGSTRANDILHKFPFSLPYAGFVGRDDGKVHGLGTNGTEFSATSISSTQVWRFNFTETTSHPSYVNPAHETVKIEGGSVRRDQGSTRANDILHKFPFSLPYSGGVNKASGLIDQQGANGNWWSAGSDSSTHARVLFIYGNYTYPENDSSYKTYGLAVRCDQGSTRANDILHKFPFSLPYSGNVYRESGATVNQGTNGNFWSAGSDSATHARHLNYSGNYTNPEYSDSKTYGFSVRCVAKQLRLHLHQRNAPAALPASTIYSTNSHSPCRM